MPASKHPLTPLHALRVEGAEAAARALGDAKRREDAARADEARAQASAVSVRAENERLREQERATLMTGALRVADMLAGARWELGAEGRRLDAERASVEASLARRERERDTEASRATTAAAQADADAVERLLEQARLAARAKAEAAAEEAAEETALARKFRHERGRSG
jgi:hypothetical protein